MGGRQGRARRWWQGKTLTWALGGLGVLALLGVALYGGVSPTPAPVGEPVLRAVGAGAPLARRETRSTLDPALFVGKAARAHRIARDIPDVLDQLYCYCECDKHVGHKSLLSCFTDGHAAT
jgi:hypothetical protein